VASTTKVRVAQHCRKRPSAPCLGVDGIATKGLQYRQQLKAEFVAGGKMVAALKSAAWQRMQTPCWLT